MHPYIYMQIIILIYVYIYTRIFRQYRSILNRYVQVDADINTEEIFVRKGRGKEEERKRKEREKEAERKRKGRGKEEERKRKGRGREQEEEQEGKRKGKGKEEERKRKGERRDLKGLSVLQGKGVIAKFASCMYTTTMCKTNSDVDIMHNCRYRFWGGLSLYTVFGTLSKRKMSTPY